MPSSKPLAMSPSAPLEAGAAGWRLCLVGPPCLVRAATGERLRLSAKDAALLAIVALDGPVSSEQVAARLWPGVDQRKGDTNLRQRFFRMRRDFDAHLVRGRTRLELAPEVETDWASTLARIATAPDAARDELLGALEFDDLPELALWLMNLSSGFPDQAARALVGTGLPTTTPVDHRSAHRARVRPTVIWLLAPVSLRMGITCAACFTPLRPAPLSGCRSPKRSDCRSRDLVAGW